MAKAAVAVLSSVFGTAASAGLGPAFGAAAVTPVVTFTPHQNPDHSPVKDTRT